MSFFDHRFEAPIEKHGVGRVRKIWYTVLFLPDALSKQLPFAQFPQLRVEGEIADVPVRNAFISAGHGRYYTIISPLTLRQADLVLGQVVEMRFRIADQDAVDIPLSLQRSLTRTPKNETAWNALTVGRKRGLAHYVETAKTEATRQRRINAVVAAITGDNVTADIAADVERLSYLLGKPRGEK